MKISRKQIAFSFLLNLLLFSGAWGCFSSSTPAGGVPGGGFNSGPLGVSPSNNGSNSGGDVAQDNSDPSSPNPSPSDPHDWSAVQMTPNSPVGSVAPGPDPVGGDDLIAMGDITGICQSGSGLERMRFNGGIYVTHKAWVPTILVYCRDIRIVYPLKNQWVYVDKSCAGGNFDFNLTTDDHTAVRIAVLSPQSSSLKIEPRIVREGDVTPAQSPQSCENDSCIINSGRDVKNSMEYLGFEDLPDCPQPAMGRAVSHEN